ncbi:MAG: DUF357 domain-containing protein [Candidatus Aenigmatarchaeota archaeon]
MALDEELRKETEKWLQRIVAERSKIKSGNEFLKNIDAYISDSYHFLKSGDLIRAFEAVIWAWAYLEIGKEQKIIKAD